MKYIIIVCDGMADYSISTLGFQTPLQFANTKTMDKLSKNSTIGMVKTIPNGFSPGSDVANMFILGYDPTIYYKGRSWLELKGKGIKTNENSTVFRCNLVTLSKGEKYEEKKLISHCADNINNINSHELIKTLSQTVKSHNIKFIQGDGFKNYAIYKGQLHNCPSLVPPHNIIGKKIGPFLPYGCCILNELSQIMKQSYNILNPHTINLNIKNNGNLPANSVWFWGEGTKTTLDNFYNKFGLKASIISSSNLIKGIGACANMKVCKINGATGYIDTNFNNKVNKALSELSNGQDLVYIHIQAPDECSHRGELENKIKSVELIDKFILKPLVNSLKDKAEFRVMVLPDHSTPVSLRTHISDPVPFMIYDSRIKFNKNKSLFNEESARLTGTYFSTATELLERFLD